MANPKKISQKDPTAITVSKKSSNLDTMEQVEQLEQVAMAQNAVQGRESPNPSNIIALQKTAGNQAVQRFLDQRKISSVVAGEEEESPRDRARVPEVTASFDHSQSSSGKQEAAKDDDEKDKVKSEAAKDDDEKDKVKSEAAGNSSRTTLAQPQININWEAPTIEHVAGDRWNRDDDKLEDVNWPSAAYSSSSGNGSSTCVEKPFKVTYSDAEVENGWRIKVASVSGGATIKVNYGGSINPISSPPGSEKDAHDAVDDMKGYYKRGSRGDWHTEAASKDHELYHYREWKESSEHYWPACQKALEELTVSKSEEEDQSKARDKLKVAADKIVKKYKDVSRAYWMTLGDGAEDRPYAAGQLTLNDAIKSVQTLAVEKEWTVALGVDTHSTANPCYKPWKPFNP